MAVVASVCTGCAQTILLPTHTSTDEGGQFLTGLRLAAAGGCVWLDGPDGDFSVVWPAGFRARSDPVELIGPSGEVIAREGDVLDIGASGPKEMVLPCRVGPVLLLGRVVSVNGVELDTPKPVPAPTLTRAR